MSAVTDTPTSTPCNLEARVSMESSLQGAAGLEEKEEPVRSWRRRLAVVAGSFAVGLACLGAASVASNLEIGAEDEPAAALDQRRLSGREAAALGPSSRKCRVAQEGEPCHTKVTWAMETGIKENPEWFPGLAPESSFEAFQHFFAEDPAARCPVPCSAREAQQAPTAGLLEQLNTTQAALSLSASGSDALFGYPEDQRVFAQGRWCSAREPQPGWQIQSCGRQTGLRVKVLTYNLFWWNLFRIRGGNGRSASNLIAGANNQNGNFDFMGFQECEDVRWVVGDAGLLNDFETLTGPHAMCMAYRKTAWRMLENSQQDVGEDRWDQWYGTRGGMWARMQNYQTGQIVFFMNHHGPLPVGTGGMCGGEATAFNILKVIAYHAHQDDVVILVGDFNAGPASQTLVNMRSRMHSLYTGASFGGVDHVFSSCPTVAETRNWGSGGSDHDALSVTLQL